MRKVRHLLSFTYTEHITILKGIICRVMHSCVNVFLEYRSTIVLPSLALFREHVLLTYAGRIGIMVCGRFDSEQTAR